MPKCLLNIWFERLNDNNLKNIVTKLHFKSHKFKKHKTWLFKYLIIIYSFFILIAGSIIFYTYFDIESDARNYLSNQAECTFESITATFHKENINDENILEKYKEFMSSANSTSNCLKNVNAIVLSSRGEVLTKSKETIDLKNISEDVSLDICKETNNKVSYINLKSSKQKVAIITKEILDAKNGSLIGYVVFIKNMQEVYSKWLKVVAITLILLLIIGLFSFYVSRYFIDSIISPIDKISQVARCIALGDFKARVTKKSDDKLSELCDTINYMAQKLFESEQLKNDFISSVSHELRTPLTAIKGWAETIEIDENEKNADTNKKGLQIIIKEAERLCLMVEELLDFSKLQSGRMILNLEKIDILAELSEAVYVLRKKAEKESKMLLYSEPEILPPVLGDKNRLKQVFINIIDNALKYTPENGVINIGAKKDDNFIKITISDNGCGISKADIPKVKTKFYKGNTQKQGSGIGLAIANEIILLHSGKLEISSEENVGTVVSLIIPIDEG